MHSVVTTTYKLHRLAVTLYTNGQALTIVLIQTLRSNGYALPRKLGLRLIPCLIDRHRLQGKNRNRKKRVRRGKRKKKKKGPSLEVNRNFTQLVSSLPLMNLETHVRRLLYCGARDVTLLELGVEQC